MRGISKRPYAEVRGTTEPIDRNIVARDRLQWESKRVSVETDAGGRVGDDWSEACDEKNVHGASMSFHLCVVGKVYEGHRANRSFEPGGLVGGQVG